jgi:hypothetical protein
MPINAQHITNLVVLAHHILHKSKKVSNAILVIGRVGP